MRDALQIKDGDEVVMATYGDHLVIYPIRRRNILDLYGSFAGLRPYPGRDVEREAAMQEAAREALGISEDEE